MADHWLCERHVETNALLRAFRSGSVERALLSGRHAGALQRIQEL